MRNSTCLTLLFAAISLSSAIASSASTLIDVAITEDSLTSKTGFAATGVTTNDFWNSSEANVNYGLVPNLEFVDGTPSGAGTTVGNGSGGYVSGGYYANGASDPMYDSYLYGLPGNDIYVDVTNLVAGAYDFYLYGHGNENNQNSVFQITVGSQSYGSEATIDGPGWLSPIWTEGVQYVEFTNVIVSFGQTVTITAEGGASGYAVLSGLQMGMLYSTASNAFIVVQPENQEAIEGSTATFSVVAGGALPLAYQWLFNNTNITAATDSSYRIASAQLTNAGNYSVIVANAYGSITSLVATLNVTPPPGRVIDVAFTGNSATSKTGFAATGVTTNDFWNSCIFIPAVEDQSSAVPNLEYEDGTPSGAGLTAGIYNGKSENVYGNGVSDLMYGLYIFNEDGNINVNITNMPNGTYDFYFCGHGDGNNENSIYQLAVDSQSYGNEATTTNSGWASSAWQEGVQYVEFTNVTVFAGQTIAIVVQPGDSAYALISGMQITPSNPSSSGPYLLGQPANQSVARGAAADFTVVVGGPPQLSYQWLLNSADILSATNSSYIVTNAQPAIAGNYSVIVTNANGSVTSAVVALNVIAPVTKVIDVAFTDASVTTKTGFAATGVSTNDFWNTYVTGSGSLPNLEFMDRTASGGGLIFANGGGVYGNGASDPMYGTYVFSYGITVGVDMTVTITNLSAGIYDFYLYGHGNQNDQYGIFHLTVGTESFGSEATTNGSGWLSSFWQEGVQYVEFTNVSVYSGQTITITVEPASSRYSVISGLQIASGSSNHVFVISQEPDQSVILSSNVTFSVVAGGMPPFGYQWIFDNTIISGATNSSYSITNVQSSNAGNYSVVVTNAYGSATSAVAALTVIEVPVIVGQPSNQAVTQGSAATFTVAAHGPTTLEYQWLLNGTNVSGATNRNLIVPNAQPIDAGNYSVTVIDPYGSVSSSEGLLTVISTNITDIDVAFTTASATGKMGFAATGVATNDFWNSATFGTLPYLRFVNGTSSGSGLIFTSLYNEFGDSLSGLYGNGASDPMYGDYFYSYARNMSVTITNLSQGAYDFYIYGHGNETDEDGVFQLTVGPQSYGTEATTNGPGWLSSVWQEGVQYVEFTGVVVPAGQTITITVEPGDDQYAVISGLQIVPAVYVVNANQAVAITNYASSTNVPISFTLGSNAPNGASITSDGVFTWAPTCEQGSTTNLITVWATDSGTPPLSSSMTFVVTVNECVEISIGSSVQQIGQSTCIPVNLFSTGPLTNLNFTLADPTDHFTNWSITPNNSAIGSATAQVLDPLHTIFNLGVQTGQALQGSNALGTICVDLLPGPSAFVSLDPIDMEAVASDNSPAIDFIGQMGRVVVIGFQSLLEASLDTNASPTLTLYGNPGVLYDLLSTTNLTDSSSWSTVGSVTLTDLFEVISLGVATNHTEFFRAVQP